MNKLNAIIVDDEPKCVELLTLLLRGHPEINLLGSAPSMATGLELIAQHKERLQLLFLDIQMPGGDGFTLLERLGNHRFKIIFTTAYDQFAIRAFRFSAVDYLLKPVDAVELAGALGKLHSEAFPDEEGPLWQLREGLGRKRPFEKLAVPTMTDIRFIPITEINYLESDNNYTTIFLTGEKIVSSKNIGHYQQLLEESDFYRISNSHLVNVKKVQRILRSKNGIVEIQGGQQLNLSAGKKEKLLRLMGL